MTVKVIPHVYGCKKIEWSSVKLNVQGKLTELKKIQISISDFSDLENVSDGSFRSPNMKKENYPFRLRDDFFSRGAPCP